MAVKWSPLITIVNQLMTASRSARVPSNPVSPLSDVTSLRPLWTAKLAPTPPTSSRCGIARISRNAVVSRLRSASCGSTVADTG